MVPAGVIAGYIAQVDLATFAKVCAGRAVGRIDGHQSRILCGLKDSPAARLIACPRGIEPRRGAAVDESVAVVAVQFNLRVVGPALRPRFRIEGDHAIERSREIERAVNQKRCGLETASLTVAVTLGNVAGVESPRDFQLRNILAVDLRERRITHAAGVMAVVRPVCPGIVLRKGGNFSRA